jgi:hypothetical protein
LDRTGEGRRRARHLCAWSVVGETVKRTTPPPLACSRRRPPAPVGRLWAVICPFSHPRPPLPPVPVAWERRRRATSLHGLATEVAARSRGPGRGHLPRRLERRRWRRGAADRGGTEGVTEWRVAGFAGSCGLLILSSDICDAGSCGPQTNRYWAATITKSNICGAGLRPR